METLRDQRRRDAEANELAYASLSVIVGAGVAGGMADRAQADRIEAQDREAIGWCVDCFGDTPEDVTADKAWECIAAQYPGGIVAFLAECCGPVAS